MSDLLRRQRATQATLDRYRGKVFSWQQGITCVHLARFHLKAMGHAVPTVPRIRSALGARRALADNGWADVAEMLAGVGCAPIAPAMMLQGDLALLDSADGLAAIFICAGPHKLLGWREDAEGLVVLDVDLAEVTAAFRV